MAKTIDEINEKIKKGKVVVVTAEEIIKIVEEKGSAKAAKEVDVVTTGTFGPMCSSGAYFNLGQTKPRIKLGGGYAYMNDVPVYTGLAAMDIYIGATSMPDEDPRNKVFPGEFKYGGGHVIEDLVAGKDVKFVAKSYGTNCYPRKELKTWINLKDFSAAVLFNPRNSYQNYNVAVNCKNKIIYTYMGVLKPKMGNANYCGAGQLSPLLNDPFYKTVGIGTRIFLGGGIGYVVWPGTQHNPLVERTDKGVPSGPAGTLAVMGDLKQMSPEWLRGTSVTGYGTTLTVGIGIPIPILNEEIVKYTAIKDEDIYTEILDYGNHFPNGRKKILGEVNYAQLKKGRIIINGKEVVTACLSSYAKAREIAEILKKWITEGKFLLTKPVQLLPDNDNSLSPKFLKERPID